MQNQNKDWIVTVFQDAATHFADRALGADSDLTPIVDWEIQQLREGNEANLVDINGSFFSLSGDRKYSLFTLNREYLTHIAEYVRLIIHDGYDQHDVKFEYQSMDIVVFTDDRPLIAIEVKRSEKLGEGLRAAIFRLLPDTQMAKTREELDAKRKIEILLKIRAPEFRIVTPTATWRYEADYPGENQLILNEIKLS